MTYTSAASVKTHLGITDSSFDTIITQLVSDADVEINSILNIDGFDSDTAENEIVSFKKVYAYTGGYYRFPVKNLNVKTVTEINGESYTGTKGVGDDYYIKLGRVVYLDDLYNYVNDTSFDMFTITYTYGWEEEALPDDIKLLAKLRVVRRFREMYPNHSLSSNQMAGVESYRMGEESIKFDTKTISREQKTIDRVLQKYKKVHVF